MASCSHSNPRKFSEKIALHRQKEAEEKAEYDKIMSECAIVKGSAGRVPATPMGHMSSVHPPPAYNAMSPDISSRLLSPSISHSANRHGSLPNVNAAMQNLDHSGLSSDGMSLMMGQRIGLPQVVHPHHHHHSQSSSNHHTAAAAAAHQQQQLQQQQNGVLHGHHVSLREQQHTGPIRSAKSRIDTSPYGSSYHLLPPANPVDWRRTVSDSSLHQSVHGSHESLSKHQGHSHLSSQHKKNMMDEDSRFSSQKQGTPDFSGYLLPNDPSDKKPGSLPDLSSFAGVSSSLNNNNRTNGVSCSSNENSPPGPHVGSPGLSGGVNPPPTSHLTHNPCSPDLCTSSWSPNHHQPDGGGGGDYVGGSQNNNHLSYSTTPQASSPISYGGRCTSPVDVVGGSPHSPQGNPLSPTSSIPPRLNSNASSMPHNNTSYEDLEAYSQDQVELNREFQRFTMMDTWDNSTQYSQNYYYRGNPTTRYEPNEQQPMNELVNFLTNMDSKVNHPVHHSPSNCAQTPSGIPDIILTDDAGTDQDLQGLAMSSALECVNEDSLKADLGKLDDSMLRLLTESAGSDQAIADPVTEEHLKLI